MHLYPFAVRIVANFNFQVFVQCDSDLMLARRVQRDIVERGRDVQSIIDQLVPPPVTFQDASIFICFVDICDT